MAEHLFLFTGRQAAGKKSMGRSSSNISEKSAEEIVHNLMRQILRDCGSSVIEARNRSEALELCGNGDCQFDLLMTDVVIPRISQRDLVEKLKTMCRICACFSLPSTPMTGLIATALPKLAQTLFKSRLRRKIW